MLVILGVGSFHYLYCIMLEA